MNEAWTLAIEALSWVEVRRVNEDSALSRAIIQLGVKESEIVDEAKRLVFEVLKSRNSLDYLIDKALAPNQLRRLEVGVRSFLRLYTYMISYGGSSFLEVHNLAEHARSLLGSKKLKQVTEAIDLIPQEELPWSSFTPVQALAYRYFNPEWYVEYLLGIFGEDKVVELIKPIEIPKYIRVNTLKANECILDSLFSLGFQFVKVPELKYTYRVLGKPEELADTAFYREGDLILQDKASVLVGEVASPKPTDVVLDICAAPGVKTSHLSQLMGNHGKIISVDYDTRRLAYWRTLIDTMGVANAEPVLADAKKPGEIPDVKANLVVLDPPCTGTGTFNEHPSGKWRLNRNSIHNMARIQMSLIANAASHVLDGGALVYSTCSITFEENEAVILDFLSKNPSFELKDHEPRIGEPGLRGLVRAQRLYPYPNKCQGFFIARLEKTG